MNESDKTAAEIESLRAEVARCAALRERLEGLAKVVRQAMDAHPGAIVAVEPVALIDWIAALLSDGDTKATHEGARRRTQRILDTIKGGSFGSFGLLAPTLVPVADGGAT